MRIQRDENEAKDALPKLIVVLQKLCELYDGGVHEVVVCIGTILRTLLKTNGKQTKSLLMQTGNDGIAFADTTIKHRGGMSFWEVGSHVHDLSVWTGAVYAGLLVTTLTQSDNGVSLDFKPLGNRNQQGTAWLTLQNWYNQEVFCSDSLKMTRKAVIETITDLEGGAHFDETITEEYAKFRNPAALDITILGQPVHYGSNPVYVSLRQIAAEVLMSFEKAGLMKA